MEAQRVYDGMRSYRIRPEHGTMKETPAADRPRERMERLGSGALSDEELLMLIIGSGFQGRPVENIARDLEEKLDRNPGMDTDEIMRIPGIGKAKASAIAAALELGRRRVRNKGRVISSPSDIFREIRHYASREQESLIVIPLNGAHEILFSKSITKGIVNKTLAHPREVFSDAIKARATAIAIVHNHPSGNLEPSDDDISLTKRIRLSGDILGIKVLDHLIISRKGYFSMLEHGMLE